MKLVKNIFSGGRNSDTDPHSIEPRFYTEAHNVELTGDGVFGGLRNFNGTTKIEDITDVSGTVLLREFENNYIINGDLVPCLTIFTAKTGGKFKIWCLDVGSGTKYELFEEDTPTGYFDNDRVVDGTVYSENGIDILYFTDFYNEIRQLRCVIPDSYTHNFLTSFDLSLQRRGAIGTFSNISSPKTGGGSLLSGTYQFSYRMVDPVNKKFTRWSSLTNPIHVYSKINDNAPVYAGVGLPTNTSLQFTINPSQEELDNFEYFQLAVVENIYPTGAESITRGTNTVFVAALLPIEPIANRINYSFKQNIKVGTIPLSDIVVDQAPIETVKSLKSDSSRLFGFNTKYRKLEYDNGNPSIGVGSSIITKNHTIYADPYSDDDFSSKYVGYFRDEVYRFAIVYYDKYGNASRPRVLDLSGVTGNQYSGVDVKFPARSTSNSYSLFTSNVAGKLRALGLRLNNIINHPTWAESFEIFRAKRIKNILFQTPVIPMMYVEGVGAFGEYPSIARIEGGTQEFPNAQPQTSSKIYMPKNLFFPNFRNIIKRTSTNPYGSILRKGEAQFQPLAGATSFVAVFPQKNMYGDGSFNFSGAEKLRVIDYCILKLNVVDYSPESDIGTFSGDFYETNVSGNFYALNSGDYYFDASWTGKSINESHNITDYLYFDNLSKPDSLSGEKIMDYESLQTQGIDLGRSPNIQRMAVLKLNTGFNDIINGMPSSTLGFASGVLNKYIGSDNEIITGAGVKYETQFRHTNKYIHKYTNWGTSKYIQALKIANVELGLNDDRYGDVDTQHEFISTGAKYTFTPSELIDVRAGNTVGIDIEVWGGDCFIGAHTFKVNDSSYSITNQKKNTGSQETEANLYKQWKYLFRRQPGSANLLCMPVGVDGASQYVQVILESEYNGEVRDADHLVSVSHSNGMPILNIDNKSLIRSPLTYNYNINLSKQNDQKVYFPLSDINFIQNDFNSRIIYSDIKTYNSPEQGFDIIRAINFHDLDESGGKGTKLVKAGDRLFAIQTQRITYIPIGQTSLELADAESLSVGTSSVIGNAIIVDAMRGSQHLAAIVETGTSVYIPDNRHKSVYQLTADGVRPITQFNETLFRTLFSQPINEADLRGIYDPVKRQYWLITPTIVHLFNEVENVWVSDFEFDNDNKLLGGRYVNNKLYLSGKTGSDNQISVYSMYTGNPNTLFNKITIPRVKFVTNPDNDISKVFDNQLIVASERLLSTHYEVTHEQQEGNQSSMVLMEDIPQVEGNYRLKTLRDQDGARLRGLRMLTEIRFNDVLSTLSSVLTKYRLSSRYPL